MVKLAEEKKQLIFKILVFILGFLSFGLICYLLFLPLYPLIKFQLIKYSVNTDQASQDTSSQLYRDLISGSNKNKPAASVIKPSTLSSNRVIIKKIGVDSPIIEAPEAKWQSALNRGAWRMPQTSTPDQGGNTVISGHRYKYLPPNNLTFYLLDKLTAGDMINVIWKNKQYDYQVIDSKIVPPTQISILNPTEKPILTLFTCDPIWTTKNRLVVTAELIE
jgi:sortase A